MKTTKPIASLSLDLDNEWSYLKTHGDVAWRTLPSYFDVLIPRVLDFFAARRQAITVFIVGQDAALKANRDLLRTLARAGHEIGNHSFRHEPWMHQYGRQEVEREILMAEERIEHATGQKPVGFRGPGFSLSDSMLRMLTRWGYLYDASTFPTFLMPLARAYYFCTARFSPEEKRLRRTLGGTWDAGWRPLRPYYWQMDCGRLLEIPVTTLPFLKVPIHASYLMCLAAISPRWALHYFDWAVSLCRIAGIQPSILLHPTEFLGAEDRHSLAFFPGMKLARARKEEFLADVFARLAGSFTLVTLTEHAQAAAGNNHLAVVKPNFPLSGEQDWHAIPRPVLNPSIHKKCG
jgi:peptidoglycan/xylan/chitin deacetylase (PgdA/CDA1 family)